MAEMLWVAAGLLLMLPADMEPVRVSKERVAVSLPHPPGPGQADQLFCSWSDDHGASVSLYWWNAPQPPRDLGPLSKGEVWETSIGSRPVRAVRTKLFMGHEDEVLVAWPPVADHRSSAMLYARGLSRESFDKMLNDSRIAEAGPSLNLTCEPASHHRRR